MFAALKRLSNRHFLAVDFDARRLWIVRARPSAGRPKILKLAGAAIPEDVDVCDADALGAFLGRTVAELGLGGAGLVMSVPRGQAVLNSLSLPAGTAREELPGMVRYQVEKELPFRLEEAVIDFTVEDRFDAEVAPPGKAGEAGEAGEAETINVLVAAVRLPVVDYYRQIARGADLKLHRLGLRPYADQRCVEMCAPVEPSECLAVVHVTCDETEIDVLEGGAIAFSRSAVVSIPASPSPSAQEIRRSVRAVVKEVSRSIQSHQAQGAGRQVGRVLLAGGTGIEADVAKDLARALSVECTLFDPTEAMGLAEQQDASAFISALGLAAGGAAGKRPPFDFLNPKRPTVRRNARKVRAAAIAGAAAAILAIFVVGSWVFLNAKQTRQLALETEKARLVKDNKEVEALRKRLEALDDWTEGAPDWLDHWAKLSCLMPPAPDAYVTDLKSLSDGAISFNVRARDSGVIEEMGSRLGADGYRFRPASNNPDQRDPFGYGYIVNDLRVYATADVKTDLGKLNHDPRPADDLSAEELKRKLQPRNRETRGRLPR